MKLVKSTSATGVWIRAAGENTAAQLTKHEPSIGAATVTGALHDFEDHWGRGRRQLKEKADALASMLTDAATNYLQTDTDLESNLTTENTPLAPGAGGRPGMV